MTYRISDGRNPKTANSKHFSKKGEIMKHDEPETMHSLEQVTMYSLEWLEHERRKAWQEGYAAGWKDQECDFPPHTTENPYTEGNQ